MGTNMEHRGDDGNLTLLLSGIKTDIADINKKMDNFIEKDTERSLTFQKDLTDVKLEVSELKCRVDAVEASNNKKSQGGWQWANLAVAIMLLIATCGIIGVAYMTYQHDTNHTPIVQTLDKSTNASTYIYKQH